MARVYFAAPLFCEMELKRNSEATFLLEAAGYEVYLPQRDGGEAAKGVDRWKLYNEDISHLDWCDILIAYVDGRVPDEGMCFEIGYACAKGKRIVIVSTDQRSFEDGVPNLMLMFAGTWVHSTDEAIEMLGG